MIGNLFSIMKKLDLINLLVSKGNNFTMSKLYNSNKEELYSLFIKDKKIKYNGIVYKALEYCDGILVLIKGSETIEVELPTKGILRFIK
jgi:hypothetical protein